MERMAMTRAKIVALIEGKPREDLSGNGCKKSWHARMESSARKNEVRKGP